MIIFYIFLLFILGLFLVFAVIVMSAYVVIEVLKNRVQNKSEDEP